MTEDKKVVMEIADTFGSDNAVESAHCALLNFDNVVKLNPMLGQHPLFRMARRQLVEAIRALGRTDVE